MGTLTNNTITLDPVSAPQALLEDAEMLAVSGPAIDEEAVPGLQGVVDPMAMTAAIILAGGSGERMGVDGGKQLLDIGGKPILTWACEAFDSVGDVGIIVVVCPKERQEEYARVALDPFPFVTPIVMADAGESRQESAFAGLELVPDEYEFVAIHDGARPMVAPRLILHTINLVKGNFDADGAIAAIPAVDTLKIIGEDGVIQGTPDRRVFWNAQTPQVFRTGMYRRAHAAALSDGFIGSDDSSLMERLGARILVSESSRDNIKVTKMEDYEMLVHRAGSLIEKRAK